MVPTVPSREKIINCTSLKLQTFALQGYLLRRWQGDFPDGPVVKNLPCNAGDVDSIPGQGTVSHMPQSN